MMKVSPFWAIIFLISFLGCQSDPENPSTYKSTESFIDQLNEQAGCCFKTIKVNTYQGEGYIVLSDQKGWYRAINLDGFNKNVESEWEFYQANQVQVFPSNYYHGSFSDSYGNIYEEESSLSKDLEKQGYFIEKLNLQAMAHNLTQSFGLSEKRSHEVSKTLYQWEKLKKTRSYNKKDLNRLSENILSLIHI